MKITVKDFFIDETNEKFGPHVRWNSNRQVPPRECVAEIQRNGWIGRLEVDNSDFARDTELEEVLVEYRATYRGPSEEQLAEMRAEFGAGTEIVNVLTGHHYTV